VRPSDCAGEVEVDDRQVVWPWGKEASAS